MKLDIYGGTKDYRYFSASGESDTEKLKPCPFCGSRDVVVRNTHTPHYTAECDNCEAQGPTGRAGNGDHIRTKATAKRQHTKAFTLAVEGWNTRR
jgi:Lar family restriction alleviation protein